MPMGRLSHSRLRAVCSRHQCFLSNEKPVLPACVRNCGEWPDKLLQSLVTERAVPSTRRSVLRLDEPSDVAGACSVLVNGSHRAMMRLNRRSASKGEHWFLISVGYGVLARTIFLFTARDNSQLIVWQRSLQFESLGRVG
jgi:hypothetical protein